MGYFRRRSRTRIRIVEWDAASALPRVAPSVPRSPRYLRFGEAAGAVPFPGSFALAGRALDDDEIEPWARAELRELLETFDRDLPAPAAFRSSTLGARAFAPDSGPVHRDGGHAKAGADRRPRRRADRGSQDAARCTAVRVAKPLILSCRRRGGFCSPRARRPSVQAWSRKGRSFGTAALTDAMTRAGSGHALAISRDTRSRSALSAGSLRVRYLGTVMEKCV